MKKIPKKLIDLLASDLPVARKISKLDIMILRAFPQSPIQLDMISRREELRKMLA